MPGYRVYCLDGDGHIFMRHEMACDDDWEAFTRAHAYCADCDVELWLAGRKLYTLAKGAKLPRGRGADPKP